MFEFYILRDFQDSRPLAFRVPHHPVSECLFQQKQNIRKPYNSDLISVVQFLFYTYPHVSTYFQYFLFQRIL